MALVKISECGTYISSVDFLALNIFEVDTKLLVHSFNIQASLAKHFAAHLSIRKPATFLKNSSITQVVWEKLLPQRKSTKLGIVVECPNSFSALVVLQLDSLTPIIIHQSILEGIHTFEWIDPVPNDQDTAITNSKQLVVFTKNKLIARLYSLDCTHVLFELPKPVYAQVLRRPENRDFWSLIATSSSSHYPIIYHFHNEGAKSQLLCKFHIQSLEGLDISWSKSGKWLLNFDCNNNLFGFQLQVYTSIGIFKRMYGDIKRRTVFKGDPILNINWLLEASDRDDKFELGLLNYKAEWMRPTSKAQAKDGGKDDDDNEEECIVVVGSTASTSNSSSLSIPILIASMKHLRIVSKKELRLEGLHLVWTLFNQQYKKVPKVSSAIRFGGSTFVVQAIETSESCFVLLFDSALIFCSLELTTYDVLIDSIIEVSLSISAVEFVENGQLLIISTPEDVSVYNVQEKTIHMLHQPITGAVQSVEYLGDEEIVVITSDDDWVQIKDIRKTRSPPEPLVPATRTLSVEKAEMESKKRLSPFKQDPMEEQAREPLEEDETSREKYELLPSLGSRLKRGRLSLANDSRDDFTDTFNLRGRKRMT